MRTRTLIIALAVAVSLLAACNKNTAKKSSDPVEQKLQELAGNDAKNCGTIKSIKPDDAKPASDCAMQSAQGKKPFYVSYELPGLTIAVAGTSAGKLYSVQQQSPAPDQQDAKPTATAPTVTVEPCPAELRIAASGRVTCYPAGSFGAMGGGANPHGGGMAMPPEGMANPHGGGMSVPPSGTPNPHGAGMSSSHGSATKNGNAPAKPASKQ